MTERTWILLIICITVICLTSIAADCYKAAKKTEIERLKRMAVKTAAQEIRGGK